MLYHLDLLELEKSQHFAEEAMRVAERLDDAARLVGAHLALGVTPFFQGKLEPALAQISAGLRDVRPEHAVPGLAGFSSRRAMPVLPGAHLLDARLPGPVRGRSIRRLPFARVDGRSTSLAKARRDWPKLLKG
jgi:hypothetical protein